MPEELIKLPN